MPEYAMQGSAGSSGGARRKVAARRAAAPRTFLLAALAVVAAALAVPCSAQSWPARPIRLIVASSPGSGVDLVARVLAQKLGEQLGQQVVVDNRAGAGGNLGAEVAAKSAPDGYTLFMGTPAHAINASLYRKPGYDFVRDFAPISLATTGHYVLVVNPSVPARSVKEFIALARVRPGKLNYASAGTGNATHLAGELLRALTAIDIVHVPYKGSGPALSDVIAGHVDLMFANLTAAIPHMKSGKLRALAVTGPVRAGSTPELPTLAEAGVPGYAVSAWYGVLAPSATPAEIVTRLNAEIGRALRAPEMRARLAADGADPAPGTPGEFARLIESEVATWAKVIKRAGITPE
jgi:tripartite-type tricarboxylate transporter receptor subunit TctC